jgi:short subunit dehydrogenase-like uncharacterized protein
MVTLQAAPAADNGLDTVHERYLMMDMSVEFDLVIYGASGFTGTLVAEYLAERCGTGGEIKWALAGRDLAKLARTREKLGLPEDHPLICADAGDAEALREMVRRTRCVISTVGPFQLYGARLIEACATLGVDYVDLCGEVPWMRDMILAHEEKARSSGARILFSCGFDSVPFELGVFHHQAQVQSKLGRVANRVKARIREMNGTFSGGTAESFRATNAAVSADKSVVDILKNPFALTPGFQGPKQPSGMKIEFDADLDAWVAPFLMSPINTRNVHRSNALMGHPYGTDFVYEEMRVAGTGAAGEQAALLIAAEGAELAGENGPSSGQGPSKEARESGSFDILFIGFIDGAEVLRTAVRGIRDPGYGATSRMIVECAIALRQSPETRPGFWTPVAALKERLLARLVAPEVGLSLKLEHVAE